MELSKKTLSMIKKLNKREENSIVSIYLYANGEEAHYSFGNKLCDEHDYFQIGSNTKLFTAALISKLVSLHMLHYDDTIDQYISLNKKHKYPTIENLLTHFGYRPIVSSKFVWMRLFKRHLLSHNLYKGKDSTALEKYLAMKKPPKKLYYYYSDINYAILALVIEKVCNEKYQSVMERFLKEDLGLYETTFFPNKKPLDSYHRKKLIGQLEWKENDIFMAAGGLYSSAYDEFTFAKMALDGTNLYIFDTVEKRKTILFGKMKMGVGYGWHSYISGKYFFHKGGVACFRSNLFVDKKEKICVSILSNVIGDKYSNSTTLGISIHKDLKEYIRLK